MADISQDYTKKPPRYFRSKKLTSRMRKAFNEAMRENFRGGDKRLTFKYTKSDGTIEQKIVRPFTAKYTKDGKHIVVGWAKRVGLRSFRTDRMKHVKHAFWQGFEKQAAFGITAKVDPKAIEDMKSGLKDVIEHGTQVVSKEIQKGVPPNWLKSLEEQVGKLKTEFHWTKGLGPMLALGAIAGIGAQLGRRAENKVLGPQGKQLVPVPIYIPVGKKESAP